MLYAIRSVASDTFIFQQYDALTPTSPPVHGARETIQLLQRETSISSVLICAAKQPRLNPVDYKI